MVRYRFALAAAALVAGVVGVLPACAQHASQAATHVSSVGVTTGKPSEFRFTLTKKTVPKGTVTFLVINKGALPPRLQDQRPQDEAALARSGADPQGHVPEGRQVPVPLHGDRPRRRRHEGDVHRHLDALLRATTRGPATPARGRPGGPEPCASSSSRIRCPSSPWSTCSPSRSRSRSTRRRSA